MRSGTGTSTMRLRTSNCGKVTLGRWRRPRAAGLSAWAGAAARESAGTVGAETDVEDATAAGGAAFFARSSFNFGDEQRLIREQTGGPAQIRYTR